MRVIASSKSSCGEEPKPAAAPSPRPVTVVTMTKVRAPSPQPLSRCAGEGLSLLGSGVLHCSTFRGFGLLGFEAPLLRSGRGRCEAPGEGPALRYAGEKPYPDAIIPANTHPQVPPCPIASHPASTPPAASAPRAA